MPLDVPRAVVHEHGAGFCNRGVNEIGADGSHGRHAVIDQKRRHQRSAADTGHTDDGANNEPGERVRGIKRDFHLVLLVSKLIQ
jgi:hypothetical protein